MVRNVVWLLSLIYLFSCQKNQYEADVTDLSIPTFYHLNAIALYDNYAYIAGGERFTVACIYQLNLTSLVEWKQCKLAANALSKELYAITALPDGRLMAVGYNGSIHISDSNREQWHYIQHPSWREFQSIVPTITHDSVCIVGGIAFGEGFILHLPLNDLTAQNIEEKKMELCDIKLLENGNLVAAGYGALIERSNQTKQWDYMNIKNDFFKSSAWKDSLHGIAVGNSGSIHQTDDGGQNWNVVRKANQLTDKTSFKCVAYAKDGRAICVGEKGVCYGSKDDGKKWIRLKNFTNKTLRSVVYMGQQEWLIAGERGGLWKVIY
jgi:Uncharacterized protein related to plant photosystem II stability/assembly factor